MRFQIIEYHIGSRIIYTSAAPCADYFQWGDPSGRNDCFDKVAKEMKNRGISHVVILLQPKEIQDYYNGKLIPTYKSYGFIVLSYPIADHDIPTSIESFSDFQENLVKLTKTHRILMHCYAGIGRTGLVLAGLFVALGIDVERAIQTVRSKRPGAVETKEQEQFLFEYARRLIEEDELPKH